MNAPPPEAVIQQLTWHAAKGLKVNFLDYASLGKQTLVCLSEPGPAKALKIMFELGFLADRHVGRYPGQ
jgi:hypothetical protein